MRILGAIGTQRFKTKGRKDLNNPGIALRALVLIHRSVSGGGLSVLCG